MALLYMMNAQTFHVDLLATAFKPSDAFVHAASLNQVEVVKKWCEGGVIQVYPGER